MTNSDTSATQPSRGVFPPIACAYTALAPVAALKPNPRNPNKHSASQLTLLEKVIRHQGWRAPIVVSNRSGLVVAGHARLQVAIAMGCDVAPVDFQDFASAEDEHAHLLADNRIAELAESDLMLLQGLLAEVQDPELAGYSRDALAELLAGLTEEGTQDAEPQVDRADELKDKWGVKLGQVWGLGDHRLMCGDSTCAEHVEKVLAGEKPHLMVTDPPYGVEYDPAWREGCDLGGGKRSKGKVENDDRADWSDTWNMFPGDVAYVWHGGLHAHTVAENLISSGFQLRGQIIWSKQHFVLSRGDYHWMHEPCWYAVRKGATGRWAGDRKQTTVWQIANNNSFGNPDKEETVGHGTQKPVECMARPIRNNSLPGDFIYEPFSGSGTTIIACEQLRRKCLAIELSPGYVAVAIQRWADATKKEPVLL